MLANVPYLKNAIVDICQKESELIISLEDCARLIVRQTKDVSGGFFRLESFFLSIKKLRIPKVAVATPVAKNTILHPICAARYARGDVAKILPIMPMESMRPDSVAKLLDGKASVKTLNAPMSKGAVPMPIRIRAAKATLYDGAKAKRPIPVAAIREKKVMTIWGLILSSRGPIGICITAKA